jgi:hypothetical protein
VEQKVISSVVLSPFASKYSFREVDKIADKSTFADVLFFLAAIFKSSVGIDSKNLVITSLDGCFEHLTGFKQFGKN